MDNYSFSNDTLRNLDLQYLNNSYNIVRVDRGDESRITILNQLVTSCRDSFLLDVDKFLRSRIHGDELTIALFVKTDSVKLTCEHLNHPNFSHIFPITYQRGSSSGRYISTLKITSGTLKHDDYSYTVFMFKINTSNYHNPILFWVLTERLRVGISGFTKVVPDSLHTSQNYNLLYSYFSVVYAPKEKELSNTTLSTGRFLNYNSPAGLLWLFDALVGEVLYAALRMSSKKPLVASSAVITGLAFLSQFYADSVDFSKVHITHGAQKIYLDKLLLAYTSLFGSPTDEVKT